MVMITEKDVIKAVKLCMKELRKKKKGLENFVEDNNDGSNTK